MALLASPSGARQSLPEFPGASHGTDLTTQLAITRLEITIPHNGIEGRPGPLRAGEVGPKTPIDRLPGCRSNVRSWNKRTNKPQREGRFLPLRRHSPTWQVA